jgi:isopenicillin N synthase-like dioxygenase
MSNTALDPYSPRTLSEREAFPVLDLADYLAGDDSQLPILAEQLRDAAENLGFYAIINHGVPQSLIQQTFNETKRFHGQSLETKQSLQVNEHNIGYMAMGASISRASAVHKATKPNMNEAFFVKRDLPLDHPHVLANKRFRGANQWPDDLPEFRARMVEYCNASEDLSLKLLPVYALALDLPTDFFTEAFRDPQYALRMSHYPALTQEQLEDNQFALAPHTDSSFMTLLPANDLPGLAIRHPNGEWFEQPVIPGSFTVNTGDMLYRWSNHRFRSTPHRVVNRSGAERYAIPFFFDVTCDYPMTCIPTCQSVDNPPKYEPTSYAEYMLWFASTNYPQVTAKAGEKIAKVSH